jgi:iron complex outermembrane recepter protein
MLWGIRGLALGAFTMGVPIAAVAQAADLAPRERIEVTGSHIPRVDGETGLPVQVITRDDIARGGIQTTQELLDRVSANASFGAFTEARGVGDSRAGFTAASLRGLGTERTLVLLNGRRLAPYAIAGGFGVDLSGIPVGAIERVEVLKDGASAIYGTDAIGGVINVILRKDFRGVELSGTWLRTDQGGGDGARASAAFGFGDPARDKYNVFFSLDYLRQEPLRSAEREFSRTAYLPAYGYDATSGQSWPANIRQLQIVDPDTLEVIRPGGFASARNPSIPRTGATDASCLPPYSFPTLLRPFACQFDYASVIEVIPESEKKNAFGRLTWNVSEHAAFYAEGSYYRGDFVYRISPTPVVSNSPAWASTGGLPELLPSVPTYPTAYVASLPGGRTDLPVQVQYRTVEFGPRTTETRSEQWRGVAGLQGTLRDWDYDAAVSYNANRQLQDATAGWFRDSSFIPLLTSGVVNPFGPNTPQALEQVRAAQFLGRISDNRASHLEGELKMSGTPWKLDAGLVAVAFGLMGRRERLEQGNEPILYSGDLLSAGDADPSLEESSRTVWSVLGEVNVPLTRSLEANLAVRSDRYSDFGTTTNPKVVVRWQPSKAAMLRAAVGKGFRAPTLSDLYKPLTSSFAFDFDDPLRCPYTQSPTDCAAIFGLKYGGNPSLQPEKSKQVNVGIVAEPVKGFSVAVDYYRVRIDDLITDVPDFAVFRDYDRWQHLVVRVPPNPATPGLPGRIDYLMLRTINAGSVQTSGYDLDARWRIPAGWGTVNVGLAGTYVRSYKVAEFTEFVSGPGTGATGAIPRWRHYATIDATSGPWGATLAQSFQDGYSEVRLPSCQPDGTCTERRHVGTYEVYDLQVRYTGWKGLSLSGGVKNLFDRAPPLALAAQTFQIAYDATYADARGRTWYLSAHYRFP